MGLSDSEYERIVEVLGRHPTYTEVGMYAVMWSEHCGYKYSRPVLRLFKNYREALDGAGLENAGVIDIGDGLGIVMKMETHNHPSAVEPFQGAATGVGGILRDIFELEFAPLWKPRKPPQQVSVRERRRWHRVLRQLRRRPDRRRRGLL